MSKIKFTQIPDKFKYPAKCKGALSTKHSEIVTYVVDHFRNSIKYKNQVITALNTASYYAVSDDTWPESWNLNDPLQSMPVVPDDSIFDVLGSLYLNLADIEWDVVESNSSIDFQETIESTSSMVTCKSSTMRQATPTPKEDLYIRPPMIPQFDVTKPWLQEVVNGQEYVIYTSLPGIPENQSQISVTTDISKMKSSDLLNLFPNRCIHTRAAVMYEPYGDLAFDENLGVIFPIEGFTHDEVRDNIIRYPHLYKLMRVVDGKFVSFYQNIELNGELHDVLQVWNELPDSKYIPKSTEYIKEYVVRRFLLERDKLHAQTKWALYGTLEPFLTLFMESEKYATYGYADSLALASQCVKSRVSYKQSRNPILRAVNYAK